MSGLYHDSESRIQDALYLIKPGTEPNISKLAHQFTILHGRLYAYSAEHPEAAEIFQAID